MDDFLARLEKMGPAGTKYAKAKSERMYIEQYRKSLKARLMVSSTAKTIAEREAEAYSHPEYIDLLAGLKAAVYDEERCRWALERLKIEFEMWRTNQANERYQREKV